MEKSDILTLIDADLFKINQEVLAIDGGLDFWNMPPNGGDVVSNVDWFLSQTHSLRNEFGSILYEGQATLFFLNSQDVMDQNLLNAILLLPKVIIWQLTTDHPVRSWSN